MPACCTHLHCVISCLRSPPLMPSRSAGATRSLVSWSATSWPITPTSPLTASRSTWGVEPICAALEIAPTTYWSAETRPPCARKIRDAELGPAIEVIWAKNYSVYGRRKLTKAVRKAGQDVGRDQVFRLMRERGIRGASRAKNRFTTHARPAAVRAPDLVKRDFTATAPDQLWVADFTAAVRHALKER